LACADAYADFFCARKNIVHSLKNTIKVVQANRAEGARLVDEGKENSSG
jgi:hypothetical protein